MTSRKELHMRSYYNAVGTIKFRSAAFTPLSCASLRNAPATGIRSALRSVKRRKRRAPVVLLRCALLIALTALLLATFEVHSQSPLAASEERKTFRLADANLLIELAASEPQVRAPVAVAWDADGRMFVAEM